MNLLEEFMVDCKLLSSTVTPDGEGGFSSVRTESSAFKAAIVVNSSAIDRFAERETSESSYTITTSKAVHLKFHDVVKRVSDGKLFRVTSDKDERKTPASAGLDMNQVTAEEWGAGK